MEKDYKELAKICLKSTLFEIAIKNRVDFFELLRSSDLADYNKENPLNPLTDFLYNTLKSIAKEITHGQRATIV